MGSLSNAQFTYAIYIVSFFLLFVMFVTKTRKLNQGDFYPLLSALFIGIIHNSLRLLLELSIADAKSFWFLFFDLLLDGLFLVEQYLILVFVERIQNLSINRYKIVFLTLFTTFTITSNFAMLFIGYSQFLTRFAFIGMNLSVIMVFIFISFNFYQIYLGFNDRIALLQLIASLVILTSYLFFFTADILYLLNLTNNNSSFNYIIDPLILFGQILTVIGLFSFILVFLFNLDIIYRSQTKIQDLVIFSTSGLAVYGIGKNVEESSLDTQLLTGFISAMNNFVEELEPKHLNEQMKLFQTSHRSIDIRIGSEIAVAIIVPKRTYIIKQKLEDFIGRIEAELIPGEVIISKLDDNMVRIHLKNVFPYLDVANMQTY